MNTQNDGGPAFPLNQTLSNQKGMSLRDWFAGMALQGMIAGGQGLDITKEQFANNSYALADAMLRARQQ